MDPLERLRAALADRYDVDRAVGERGMASVFGSLDRKHQRRVAIKVLKPELAASIGTERFLREIRVAAQLQHPNILALYDSGEADGLVYYVMPFVEGESLRDRLDREKQLPVDDAIRTTLEVADALQYAHGHGVVHRDIKPDNILLLKSGGHALVIDFGIARAFSEAGGDKLTQTGMAVGTPHYMSPEQAGGGAGTDGRSDLYSLACVLYEMLAGQPPFDGPNTMAILARHAMETVPSIQVVRPTIPDALEDIIMAGLAKTPADRYPSVSAFADAIASADFGLISGRTLARAIPRRTQAQRIAGGAGGAARSPRQRVLVAGGGPALLEVPTPNGTRAVALSDTYRIAFLDAHGDTLRVIERDARETPISDAEWEAANAEWRTFRQEWPTADCDHGEFDRPHAKPPLAFFCYDDVGPLWVEVITPDGPRYDVFDAAGALLATVTGRPPTTGIDPSVAGDRIALVGRDSTETPIVEVLRIVEK